MTYDVDCPSSDWQTIQKILELTFHSIPKSEQYSFGPATPSEVEVFGRSSIRQLTIQSEFIFNASTIVLNTAIAASQQVAVSDALTATGIVWGIAMTNTSTKGHGSVLNQLDAVHSITAGYYQPYTSVVCEYDTIRGPNDTDPVAFPAYSGVGVQSEIAASVNDGHPEGLLPFPHLSKSDILNMSGPPGEYRLKWVEVPFDGTAIGAIVLSPKSPQNTTQELLTCSIGAGWGLSTLNISTMNGNAAPVLSQVDSDALSQSLRTANATGEPPGYTPLSSLTEMVTRNRIAWFYPPIFPQRPVTLTEEWTRYLNPSILHLNTTIFNNLMGQNLFLPPQPKVQTEMILAGMVANGLSRIGSKSQLQGTVKQVTHPDGSIGPDGNYWFAGKGNNVFDVDPVESKDWVKFRVSSTVEGYAYNTHGATPKIAICLLLIYCLFALLHIIYAGISGISSTCWDSIGEVTALAMNSTPTAALRNTCAGITELNIFKLPVRVLTFRDAEGDGEHLELVFGNLDEKMLENKTIKANRVYGTMPTVTAHEKDA